MPADKLSDRSVVQPKKQDVDVRPNMSAERFKSFVNKPVSPEWLVNRKKAHSKIAKINKAEAQARILEAPQLKTMEVALGIKQPLVEEKTDVLNPEQKDAVKVAFDDLGKEGEVDQQVLFETFMGSTKDQEVFRGLYEKWNADYESNPVLKNKMTLNEYVREKGIEYIKLFRKQLLNERSDRFVRKLPESKDLSEDEIVKKADAFNKSIDMFVQANYGALAELNSLSETENKASRQVLMGKFMLVLGVNGFDKAGKAEVESLFKFIVDLMEYEVFTVKDYEYTSDEMVAMALEMANGKEITPEEWEARRKKSLNKNATELQEAPRQQSQTSYVSSGSVDTGSNVTYKKWEEVASDCKVHFDPVDKINKPDLFTVKFTAFEDATFKPYLRMFYDPPDSRDMKDLRFELQEQWADEDSSDKGKLVEGKTSRVFRPEEMVQGVNTLILDYVINKKLRAIVPKMAKENPNDVLKDSIMVHFADRILAPKGIKEGGLMKEQIDVFERLMTVVLKDDPVYDTLEKRVKQMSIMLDKDNILGYLQGIFSGKASGTWNMDGLTNMSTIFKKIGEETKLKI